MQVEKLNKEDIKCDRQKWAGQVKWGHRPVEKSIFIEINNW